MEEGGHGIILSNLAMLRKQREKLREVVGLRPENWSGSFPEKGRNAEHLAATFDIISLICDKIVRTQNLWFFRRNF